MTPRRRHAVTGLGIVLASWVWVFPAAGYDVLVTSTDGTPVPDVDKPDRNGDGNWPESNDMSCWLATASNLLGAGGYGTGTSAQTRATGIYNQLCADLGYVNGGRAERAINYWLMEYGKNPDSSEFKPTNTYTDVTLGPTPLASLDINGYNSLLNEVTNGKYVGVSWHGGGPAPAPEWDHAMTLVGGDRALPGQAKQSVWHDSDKDAGGMDDNAYSNAFDTMGRWNLNNYSTSFTNDYVAFGQGLNKDRYAASNYDVAWYKQDKDKNGVWDAAFREAGIFKDNLTDPAWVWDGVDYRTVHLDNEFIGGEVYKQVWLLVEYADRDGSRTENIQLRDCAQNVYDPTSVTASTDGGQLLFYWTLPHSCDWEEVLFPNSHYYYLDSNIMDWSVSTWNYIVPEPGTMALLALGGLVLMRRRNER